MRRQRAAVLAVHCAVLLGLPLLGWYVHSNFYLVWLVFISAEVIALSAEENCRALGYDDKEKHRDA